jgi:hypothetical protein
MSVEDIIRELEKDDLNNPRSAYDSIHEYWKGKASLVISIMDSKIQALEHDKQIAFNAGIEQANRIVELEKRLKDAEGLVEALRFNEMLLTNYSVVERLGPDGKDCLLKTRTVLSQWEKGKESKVV